MMIEVIGVNVQDVIDAETFGADRIELCAGMQEGGLTPSYALINQAVAATALPVNVMVRPHGNSFVYSKMDVELMCEDIGVIKQLGANGIVIGPLTEQGTIDVAALEQLLSAAEDMEVTFHRAFDTAQDKHTALETILGYSQITTMLTSGGPGNARDNMDSLHRLQEIVAGTHLSIMPGGGLKVDDVHVFQDVLKPAAMHFGTGVRINNSFAEGLSKGKIAGLRSLL